MKIKIKVHANSSREKIEKISEAEYEVWIKEKPVKGKGNTSLEKFLKNYFGKKCIVVSGRTSRVKFVELSNL